MVVAHNFATGLWAAKWLSKQKRIQTNFPQAGMYLWIVKETFVHIYQN